MRLAIPRDYTPFRAKVCTRCGIWDKPTKYVRDEMIPAQRRWLYVYGQRQRTLKQTSRNIVENWFFVCLRFIRWRQTQ